MDSVSLVSDLSFIPSLGLFISLCSCAGEVRIVVYSLWLFSQLIVGWGLAGLLLNQRDELVVLFEVWLVLCFSCAKTYLQTFRFLKFLYFLVVNLLFAWRFINVPQNWVPIGSATIGIMALVVLLSDILFVGMVATSCIGKIPGLILGGRRDQAIR